MPGAVERSVREGDAGGAVPLRPGARRLPEGAEPLRPPGPRLGDRLHVHRGAGPGDLEDPEGEPKYEHGDPGGIVLVLGILVATVGLLGGNLRALPRVLGVEARLVRRAAAPAEAAGWAVGDCARAVEAARDAGTGGDLGATPGPELVRALWVLREAGPRARGAAEAARELADRLAVLLEEAAPAAGLRNRLQAGPAARDGRGRTAPAARRRRTGRPAGTVRPDLGRPAAGTGRGARRPGGLSGLRAGPRGVPPSVRGADAARPGAPPPVPPPLTAPVRSVPGLREPSDRGA